MATNVLTGGKVSLKNGMSNISKKMQDKELSVSWLVR